jgi:hypothetical protein
MAASASEKISQAGLTLLAKIYKYDSVRSPPVENKRGDNQLQLGLDIAYARRSDAPKEVFILGY